MLKPAFFGQHKWPLAPVGRRLNVRIALVYLLAVAAMSQASSAQSLTELATGPTNGVPRLCMPVTYRESPTTPAYGIHIAILSDRYEGVKSALDGRNRTGAPLVGYFQGRPVPMPCGDDTGLFYFVPLIARVSQHSVDFATDVFLLGTLLSSALIGLAGWWVSARYTWQRLLAVFSVSAATYVAYKMGDLCVVQAGATLALVPWTLYFFKPSASPRLRMGFMLMVGVVLGLAQWVRSQSGTPVLLFMLILLILGRYRKLEKLVLIGLLVIGIALPTFYSHVPLYQRDRYLSSADVGYSPPISQHLLWHTVYVGLGYLNNPYVPGWRDVYALDAVAKVSPSVLYGSADYERILRARVLEVARTDPRFIFYTVTSKLGVLACMFLLCANIGIVASILYPKGLAQELAWWVAIAFASLTGIIAIPLSGYVIGMIVLGFYYWYVSICHAFFSYKEPQLRVE